jgi:F420-non-reducing hydrogenase small subunit
MSKPRLALYWAASCGGCEIAILDLHEKVLAVEEAFEIVFWPVALDVKYADLEAMGPGSIDLCLFNGAIRTSENEHLARALRERARTLVAFGSCAHEGCIPALANTVSKQAIFRAAYHDSPSTANPEGIEPQPLSRLPDGTELALPEFWEEVKALDQVVDVDYYVPGCPPQAHRIWEVVEAVLSGAPLPAKGSVLGAGEESCCAECPRPREEKRLRQFLRPHEVIPEAGRCLLDQGLVCMGPATRSGCGALCPQAGMPCRGCYGPPPRVRDQGAKMVSALASVIDSTDEREIQKILDGIPDPVGTFYRFSLGHSILRKVRT